MAVIKQILFGFTGRLLLMVIFVTAGPLSTMGWVTYTTMENSMEENLEGQLFSTGHDLIRMLDEYILSRDLTVRLIATSAQRAGFTAAELRSLHAMDQSFSWIGISTADGFTAQSGERIATTDSSVVEDIASWRSAAITGSRMIDLDAREGVERERFIVFIEPLGGTNYLFAQLPLEEFYTLITDVRIGETGLATLFNTDGVLIGHINRARYGSDMSHYPIIATIIERGEPNLGDHFLSGDGQIKWGMTMILPELQAQRGIRWGVIVDQTIDELYAPVRELLDILLLVGTAAFVLAIIVGIVFAWRIVKPLRLLESRLRNIASDDADLTQRIEITGRGEIGQISHHFNEVMEMFRLLMVDLRRMADVMGESAQVMRSASDKSDQLMTKHSHDVDVVANSMQQMLTTVKEVAQSAEHAANAASEANREADHGEKVVGQALHSMKELSVEIKQAGGIVGQLDHESQEIGKAVDVIRAVAEQTNLLALNAAIEAAGAGQQGRGFAVVAEEVRSLAGRSREATIEIREIVERLQKSSGDVVAIMQQSGEHAIEMESHATAATEALIIINNKLSTLDELNGHISGAAEEQRVVTEEVGKNVGSIRELAKQTDQVTREAANAGRDVDKRVQELLEKIRHFRI